MKAQSILLATTALATCAAAECTRSFLVDATAKYVAAQTEGKPATLAAIAADTLNYTESDKTVDIKTGVLAQAMKIDHNRSIHDTTLCATFTELIVADGAKPYVIGTRMVFTDNKASLIETIATKPGDWAFNATGYLHWNSLETWDPIPLDKRDSRAVIQAAGDAYFNRFNNASFAVPFGTPCARLEGGAYTDPRGSGNGTCDLGLPSTITVTNRRYVVDEEMGAVSIYLGFPGLDRSVADKPMPDSHFFRVEAGEIRYIHTVTTCEHAGCGMNGTGIPPV
ncbi:hypothetical protein C8A01DRAFT_36426 [Parachaetomium inaequale]|uniref:DUF8021 domain-containing protein n=1 Tax=Parachaetomium inaequale TaxID=2588326 RepID=A0AAN6PF83_9PEZI|nr:hypothetical protein C8A01DRAFT_36426 [Parachaetomium inaequale]